MNAPSTASRHQPPPGPSFIRAAMRPLAAGLASLALSVCLHCATAPPPAPEAVDLSCKLPTLAPLAETKGAQEKGGIVIGGWPMLWLAASEGTACFTGTP